MSTLLAQPQVQYFVPDGADSVMVHVEHSVTLSATESSSRVWCYLYSTTTGGKYIYDETEYWYSSFHDIFPIVYVLDDPPDGTWLGFSFHTLVEDEYYGLVSWLVRRLTVTAFGNELKLEPGTWAAIKGIFR